MTSIVQAVMENTCIAHRKQQPLKHCYVTHVCVCMEDRENDLHLQPKRKRLRTHVPFYTMSRDHERLQRLLGHVVQIIVFFFCQVMYPFYEDREILGGNDDVINKCSIIF